MAIKTCEECGIEYEGHHRSKRCDDCRVPMTPDPLPMMVDSPIPVEFIGSDVVLEGVVEVVSDWRSYGMCSGGYEVFPGWVWSQGRFVCVRGDAPKEVLEVLHDSFQRRVVNRRPVMGDSDYEVGG